MRHGRRRRGVPVVVLCAVLTACSGDGDDDGSVEPTVAPASSDESTIDTPVLVSLPDDTIDSGDPPLGDQCATGGTPVAFSIVASGGD